MIEGVRVDAMPFYLSGKIPKLLERRALRWHDNDDYNVIGYQQTHGALT